MQMLVDKWTLYYVVVNNSGQFFVGSFNIWDMPHWDSDPERSRLFFRKDSAQRFADKINQKSSDLNQVNVKGIRVSYELVEEE